MLAYVATGVRESFGLLGAAEEGGTEVERRKRRAEVHNSMGEIVYARGREDWLQWARQLLS